MSQKDSALSFGIPRVFPPEVWDNVIDGLQDDMSALRAVSLSHRTFLPRCRVHKFQSVLVTSSKEASRLWQVMWRTPVIGRVIEDLTFKFSFTWERRDLVDAVILRLPDDYPVTEDNFHGLYAVDSALFEKSDFARILQAATPKTLSLISHIMDTPASHTLRSLTPQYVPTWRILSYPNRKAIHSMLRNCGTLTDFRLLGAWQISLVDLMVIMRQTVYETSHVQTFQLQAKAFFIADQRELDMLEEERKLDATLYEPIGPRQFSSVETVVIQCSSLQPADEPAEFIGWTSFARDLGIENLDLSVLYLSPSHIMCLNDNLAKVYTDLASLGLTSSCIAEVSSTPLCLSNLEEFQLQLIVEEDAEDDPYAFLENEPYQDWAEFLANSVRSREKCDFFPHFYLTLEFNLSQITTIAPLGVLAASKDHWKALDDELADPDAQTYWHVTIVFSDKNERYDNGMSLGFPNGEAFQKDMVRRVRELLPKMGDKIEGGLYDDRKEECTMEVKFEVL